MNNKLKAFNVILLFFLLCTLSFCTPSITEDKVKVAPTKHEEGVFYSLLAIRYNGKLEIQDNIEKTDNFKIDPIEIAQESFIKTWKKNYSENKNENKPIIVFVKPEETGLINTVLTTKPKAEESLTRNDPIKLTKSCIEEINNRDLQNVFWIDIKKISIELNNKTKKGRLLTIYGWPIIIPAIFGGIMWYSGDYQISISMEFGYTR